MLTKSGESPRLLDRESRGERQEPGARCPAQAV